MSLYYSDKRMNFGSLQSFPYASEPKRWRMLGFSVTRRQGMWFARAGWQVTLQLWFAEVIWTRIDNGPITRPCELDRPVGKECIRSSDECCRCSEVS